MSWHAGSPTSGGGGAGHRGRPRRRRIRRSRTPARSPDRVSACRRRRRPPVAAVLPSARMPAKSSLSGGATMSLKKFGIGQAVTRKEDDPILRGHGRYVADHAPEGAMHATVLRSPHAHARFRVTDVATARAMTGVRLVLTADEAEDLGAMPWEVAFAVPKIAALCYALHASRRV